MRRRILGRTGAEVSVVGLGAGPVPALMTGDDAAARRAVLARAVEVGINWVDTAPGYGAGRSESGLGQAMRELGVADRIHVATKVRFTPEGLADPEVAVRRSLTGSLGRLGVERVALLQIHNGIAARPGEIADSLTPEEVLRVLPALQKVRDEGLTRFIGLTGIGAAGVLREAIESGGFDTIQTPHNLLAPADAGLLARCEAHGMGVFAIRVFAGGALLGRPPSAHTRTTRYFPLAVYEEDLRRATALGLGDAVKGPAVRHALAGAHVALIGLATPAEVDEAAELVGQS